MAVYLQRKEGFLSFFFFSKIISSSKLYICMCVCVRDRESVRIPWLNKNELQKYVRREKITSKAREKCLKKENEKINTKKM